ncbi:MAG: NfeD family protein [Bacillota bacterium]
MEFFVQIGLLFANMTWPVMVCLIVGLLFVMIEIFQPGFGVFGTIGLLLLILGIILRAIYSQDEDNVLAQIFIILFFVSIIIISAFIIMVKSSKMGWLSRSPLIEKSTAVSTGISEGTTDYTRLKDKIGIATTNLRPTGKIRIDDEILDAYAEGFYIKKGEGVKVIETRGGIVTVRRFE